MGNKMDDEEKYDKRVDLLIGKFILEFEDYERNIRKPKRQWPRESPTGYIGGTKDGLPRL